MWDKNFPQNITLGKVASIWKLLKSDQSQANQLYGNPKKVLKFTYYSYELAGYCDTFAILNRFNPQQY